MVTSTKPAAVTLWRTALSPASPRRTRTPLAASKKSDDEGDAKPARVMSRSSVLGVPAVTADRTLARPEFVPATVQAGVDVIGTDSATGRSRSRAADERGRESLSRRDQAASSASPRTVAAGVLGVKPVANNHSGGVVSSIPGREVRKSAAEVRFAGIPSVH